MDYGTKSRMENINKFRKRNFNYLFTYKNKKQMKKNLIFGIASLLISILIFVVACEKQEKKTETAPPVSQFEIVERKANAIEWAMEFSDFTQSKKRKPSIFLRSIIVADTLLLDIHSDSLRYTDGSGQLRDSVCVVIDTVHRNWKVINVNMLHKSTVTRNQYWGEWFWTFDHHYCTVWSQPITGTRFGNNMPVSVPEEYFMSVTIRKCDTGQELTAGINFILQ